MDPPDRAIHATPEPCERLEVPPARSDLKEILAELAKIRGRLRGGCVDAVAVVREGREELEQRGLEDDSGSR